MSLHEKSDGILETSVTWDDLEKNLSHALRTDARFGAKKSVEDIGEGNGFASRCALVTCDWVGTGEDEKLPARVVLKIPSALPFRKMNDALPPGHRMVADETGWEAMGEKLRGVHNVEVATYEFVKGFDGLTMPRMYYGNAFCEGEKLGGQICLEFMENARMMNFHDNYSVETMKEIARALGKMQACSLLKEPSSPELQKPFIDEFQKNCPSIEAYRGMFRGLLAADSSEITVELLGKIDALLPDYYRRSNLLSTIHVQMGFRPVLVNGDLRTENVLIDNATDHLAALIDWQCTHLGVGVEDLHRIALFAMSAVARRATMPMLISVMHSSLVKNLAGAEPPYSLEKLLQLSDLLFPHCALYFAGGSIAFNLSPKSGDDSEKARIAVKLAKVIGALEDVVSVHEKIEKNNSNLTTALL